MNIDGDSKMPFGKHKGEAIDDVPADYLLWCLQGDWLKEKYLELFIYLSDIEDSLLEEQHHNDEQRYQHEAYMESVHGDWGDRD